MTVSLLNASTLRVRESVMMPKRLDFEFLVVSYLEKLKILSLCVFHYIFYTLCSCIHIATEVQSHGKNNCALIHLNV
jgi:hypothetical protein